MDELISIVVPVYNKKTYLAECFESIEKQTYENIEVIVVDDGSTDNSADICLAYAEKDARFHFIHQENGGQNSARKKGAENATGDYLIFVDADDWVSHDMCRVLMDNMKKTGADIVCGAIQKTRNGIFFHTMRVPEGTYTPEDVIENFVVEPGTVVLKSGDYFATVFLVARMYKKATVIDALRHFDMRIRFGEDMALLFYMMHNSNCISYIDDIVYYIRVVNESASMSVSTPYLKAQLKYLAHFTKNAFTEAEHYSKYECAVDAHILKGLLLSGLDVFDDFEGIYPFFEGDKSGRVALYGAGMFGEEFYRKNKSLNIVGWFDKKYEMYQNLGLPVKAPTELKNTDFDYVLITVLREKPMNEIKQEFTEFLPRGKRIYTISDEILNSEYSRRKLDEIKA